ncbi:uncharacterized protein LOC143927546 [Lithobates pipiens]
MNRNISPKRGRTMREVGGKPTTVLNSSTDGTLGTKTLPSDTQRLCRSNNSASLALEEFPDWNSPRRTHHERFMYKVDTSTRNSQDPISQPQREAQPTLPLIRRGATQAAAPKTGIANKSADFSHPEKKSQKRGKLKPEPTASGDMTPWVKASPSESSLTALMQILPSPPTPLDNTAEQRHGQRAPKNAVNKVSWGPQAPEEHLPKEKPHNRAKQKARTGVTKRRTANKFHSIKLPPVPAVTELSFSRNFSFSFFELPQHLSPQHWLQRQKTVYVLMRQLQ